MRFHAFLTFVFITCLTWSSGHGQDAKDFANADEFHAYLDSITKMDKGELAGVTRDEAMGKLRQHYQRLIEARKAFVEKYPEDLRAQEISQVLLMENSVYRSVGLDGLADDEVRAAWESMVADAKLPPSIRARASEVLLMDDKALVETAEIEFADWEAKLMAHMKEFPESDLGKLRLARVEMVLKYAPERSDEVLAELLDSGDPGMNAKAQRMQEDAPLLQAKSLLETDPAAGELKLEELAASPIPRIAQEAGDLLLAYRKDKAIMEKPLDLKFTAVDGTEVNLADMKGKVILIDFWATWCGPCVAELPNLKKTYEALHDKGFEIIGIEWHDS
jgi:thiol-disulfide isomerase/thioredoxin